MWLVDIIITVIIEQRNIHSINTFEIVWTKYIHCYGLRATLTINWCLFLAREGYNYSGVFVLNVATSLYVLSGDVYTRSSCFAIWTNRLYTYVTWSTLVCVWPTGGRLMLYDRFHLVYRANQKAAISIRRLGLLYHINSSAFIKRASVWQWNL